MRILVFEPLKEPYVKDIEDDIQAMQEVVGGSIEPIYFEQTNDALCWCNDEFLLNGSKPNRIVGNTLVHGTFYISGNCLNEYGEWDSCSLADKQIEKYKQQFDGRVHSIMQNRFKNAQDAKDVAAKWQGATAALAAMYGIDGTDPDALKDAIEKDDGLFSAQAEAQGLTPEQFRENLRLRMDAQTGRNMQEQMRIEAEKQATFQRWESEAAELTETFPNFDLAYELENEAFLDGLNRGLSVRDAFFVAHMDEIVAGSNAAAKSEATQKVVDNFNQRAARPAENGASHKPAVIRKTDPSKFTDADLDEIARRSRRGETIRF